MKNKMLFLMLALTLSGCATYKVQKGIAPYDKGFVVSRDNYTILEYTVGQDSGVPNNKQVAEERFKRRKLSVDAYYKKMGYIQSRTKETLLDPPVYLLKLIGGFFRLPFVMAGDYKYNHDPKYRDKVDKAEEEEDEREQARVNKIRAELDEYIKKDLAAEPTDVAVLLAKTAEEEAAQKKEELSKAIAARAEVVKQPPAEAAQAAMEAKSAPELQQAPVVQEEEPASILQAREEAQSQELMAEEKTIEAPPEVFEPAKPQEIKEPAAPPVAVITANPVKGASPLKVKFNGGRSYSPKARIVSYSWEFGDGDVSSRKDPVNTYWSTTYGSRHFTAVLTVKDSRGNTATASTTIEVTTK